LKRIALLSDTHGWLDPAISKYLESCDEIWHAGDIGKAEVIDELNKIKPTKAVFGNIDGGTIRRMCPEVLSFSCEDVDVLIIHIGGYPGRYSQQALQLIKEKKPKLFICGHSHILKVMYDPKNQLLAMNPGAAGKSGFHKVKTFLRFTIDGDQIKDLEVIELGARSV
jgi:putative phosphoesterase